MKTMRSMRKRIIILIVSGFFISDTEKELKKIADRMKIPIVLERKKGCHSYPLKVVLTGLPEQTEPFIRVIESMQEEYHFTIKSLF
jgi:hypothetical protein